ncbi:hypothetical protein [Bacillus pseudomycoides]|uniref:Group-specific protein n=1 Tax=Bacillus pseudomycoides TaxID=64104 RepID=A0A2A8C6T2_9BACI|nr:hypothetical protein [Bacillus pseudomycoides]PEM70200.1 hypothetical protein CN613_09985 [Bacillus pseudomycoides]PFZ11580.1 hypothetical protein COL60_07405 [Bacillus pseudomycoides]PFZ12007.1 hypothetical protein COL63_14640 [Bacillus pseudomycoides]PGC51242.1 hypothetical protein COM14_05875 [Bacillus pseudomycoides]PGD31772.1 hypothetical protein COM30_16495 [Bacillus pseudomycoides]
MNQNKFIFVVIVLSLLGILAYSAYKYTTEGTILGGTIFACSLIISYLINHMTWGDPNGVSEESQDEMGQQITYKSFKIGYFVLVVIMFILLIWSEGFSTLYSLDNIHNLPLFIALCSSFIVIPLVEFVVSKRYQ